MSLDVYLKGRAVEHQCVCPRCDHEHAVSDAEDLYSANITHNLNVMADKAGIYLYVWRPDEIGVTVAGQLIEPLRDGIERMEADPEFFRQFDAGRGWGTYAVFLPWLRAYLAACEKYPEATVRVSR